MSIFKSFGVNASGMTAERFRMDIISQNVANANTTRTEEGTPYRRKVVTFQERTTDITSFSTIFRRARGMDVGDGVKATGVFEDQSDLIMVYDPSHPDADENGYVTFTAYEEGEFVLLSKAADKKTVITLEDQIKVNSTVKVKAGKTKKNAMGLVLPAEYQDAKVEYASDNKKIAKINKNSGKVTAVKKGKAKLTAKVTLPDGTVKEFETTITVK